MQQQLLDVLEPTLLQACRDAIAKHPDDRFYGVALYTNGEYNTLACTFFTAEGLEQVAKKYVADSDDDATLEDEMRILKWSPCDSPLHLESEQLFSAVDEVIESIWDDIDEDDDDAWTKTCMQIHETCMAALIKLRDTDVFDRDQVVFNLLMGDQSDEEMLLNAEELNTEAALASFRQELEIDDEELAELRQNRWDM